MGGVSVKANNIEGTVSSVQTSFDADNVKTEVLTYTMARTLFKPLEKITCCDLIQRIPERFLYDTQLLQFTRVVGNAKVIVSFYEDSPAHDYLHISPEDESISILFVFCKTFGTVEDVVVMPSEAVINKMNRF